MCLKYVAEIESRSRSLTRLRSLIGLREILVAERQIAKIAQCCSEYVVGESEFAVPLDCPFERRYSLGVLPLTSQLNPDRVILECLERRGRRLLNWRVELADRGKRLTQMLAHRRRGAAESLEHLLFTFGFDLLVGNRLPTLAVDRLQRDHVIAAEAGNRPNEQRLDSPALTDLTPDLARDLFIGLTAPSA